MPRTLPAALTTAMDSGSFKVYVALGKRTYTGTPPASLAGHTTLITTILYYKYNGLDLTVKYASPNLPEDDGLIVGDKYYLERGVTIAGVNHTIKSASLRFDDYEITKQIVTARFSLFSPDEKPEAVAGDDTYTNVLTALNPNAYQLGTVDFKATPENAGHWDYNFYPTGKQVSLKSYASLLPHIRQKYLLQATDNSDDASEDEIQFFHLRSPTALGDWTLGESSMGGVSVCYSPALDLFLAVDGQNGTIIAKIHTSTDGTDWTESASPGGTLHTAAWIEELGLFLVAGGDFSSSKRLFTSPDGTTWTGRDTANANNYIRGFAYSPALGRIVLVTNLFGSTHNVQTSPDGITWTERTTTGTPQFYGVAWSPELSLFVAVGTDIHSSPDGITWTERSIAGTFYSVAWSPELSLFVAVGDGGLTYTSPDGLTWTSRTAAAARNWKAIAWSPSLSLFTAVANSGTGNRSMTSPDGIAWTSKPTPADNPFTGIVWAEELGIFVAVSYSSVYSNMHAGNITQTADHTIQQGDVTLLKDGAIQAFLWRDEASTIHTNGTDTSLIHNLGYLESTDQPPASLRNSDRASVTVGIHLKYKSGDIFTLQVNANLTATYLAEVTEILDPNAEIGWRCEISLIERFSNTNAGAMPSTIERVSAYTPLVTTNFTGNLDATVNNLQALAEKIDDLILSGGVTNGDSHDHSGGDGAQINHTTLANIGTNTHAQIDTHVGSTSNPHSVTAAQAGAIPSDGWIAVSATWTRTGNHTFTVSGDVTATYRKGSKVRYKDGGSYEYGVIASSAYSSPNTTVTLITNTDYAMAAATITDKYISYIENPEAFPQVFNWSASPTNFAGSYTAKWYPLQPGKLKYIIELSATGAVTGNVTITLPIAHTRGTATPVIGVGYFFDTGVASYPGQMLAISTTTARPIAFPAGGTYATQSFMAAAVPFTWANGDEAQFTGDYEY